MTRAPKVTTDRTTATANLERQIKEGLAKQLNVLLHTAYELGFVITVEAQALEPLAMGNYRMIGNVRGAR